MLGKSPEDQRAINSHLVTDFLVQGVQVALSRLPQENVFSRQFCVTSDYGNQLEPIMEKLGIQIGEKIKDIPYDGPQSIHEWRKTTHPNIFVITIRDSSETANPAEIKSQSIGVFSDSWMVGAGLK